MTGRRVAIGLAAACLVLLAAGSVVSWDVSGLAPRIESAFAHATGRALGIGGPVRFRLLPSPSLNASEVTIANLPGGSRPAMIRAAEMQARLDLGALLRRRIEIENLSLSRPDVLLETVRGVPNWVFRPARPSGAIGQAHAPGAARPGLRLDALAVTDGRLTWRTDQIGSGEIALGRLRARRDGSGLTLVADARHGAMHVRLSLAAGAPLGGGHAVPVRATAELGPSGIAGRIGVDGEVGPGRAFSGHLRASIAQLASLDGLFPHAGLPKAEDVRADGRIAFADGRWSVGGFSVTGGKADPGRWVHGLLLDRSSLRAADAAGDLVVEADGNEAGRPVVLRGTIGSPLFWSRPAGRAPVDAVLSMGSDRVAVSGTMVRTGARSGALHGHLSLQAPSVRHGLGADGTVDVEGHPGSLAASLAGRFEAGGADLGAQTLSLSLQGQALAAHMAQADGTTWASWSEDLATRHVRLSVHGHGLPAAPVISLIGGPEAIHGTLAVNAALARAPGGWSGPFDAMLTDGMIEPALARSLIAPVLAASRLPAISGEVTLRCASASGSVAGTSLSLRAFSLASSSLDGQGQGTIGLAPPGRLDLLVRPSLRLGPTYLSTSLSVTGPFDAPRFALVPVDGRFGLRIGPPMAAGACAGAVGEAKGGAATDGSAKPGGRHKLPNAAELLRGLGLR